MLYEANNIQEEAKFLADHLNTNKYKPYGYDVYGAFAFCANLPVVSYWSIVISITANTIQRQMLNIFLR